MTCIARSKLFCRYTVDVYFTTFLFPCKIVSLERIYLYGRTFQGTPMHVTSTDRCMLIMYVVS